MTSPREQEALDATAAIRVDPRVAKALVRASAALLTLPALLHLVVSPRSLATSVLDLARQVSQVSRADVVGSNTKVMERMESVEEAARNDSPMAHWVRPLVQAGLFELGSGNAQVRQVDGALIFEPSLAHLLSDGFDAHTPMPAISRFHDDLRRQGIQLVLVPTPSKPTIDGALWGMPGLIHPEWPAFEAQLVRYEIPHVSVYETLLPIDPPRYLATDTHWRPVAMEAVATQTAAVIRELGAPTSAVQKKRRPVTVRGTGDLVNLLGLPDGVVAQEKVRTRPVKRLKGAPSVLILGDSFSNIYHDKALGFGMGAGFPEALEAALGTPVSSLLINDDGAESTRKALAAEPDRLKGIEVVVWQFAERELTLGDWEVVPLSGESDEAAETALRLPSGQQRTVKGVVQTMADRMSPSSAVYANRVLAMRIALPPQELGEAVDHAWVFTWDLKQRLPSRLPPVGVDLQLTLRPLSDAVPEAQTAARTVLDKPAGEAMLWLSSWEEP